MTDGSQFDRKLGKVLILTEDESHVVTSIQTESKNVYGNSYIYALLLRDSHFDDRPSGDDYLSVPVSERARESVDSLSFHHKQFQCPKGVPFQIVGWFWHSSVESSLG